MCGNVHLLLELLERALPLLQSVAIRLPLALEHQLQLTPSGLLHTLQRTRPDHQ